MYMNKKDMNYSYLIIIIFFSIQIESTAQTKKIALKTLSSNDWAYALNSPDNFGLNPIYERLFETKAHTPKVMENTNLAPKESQKNYCDKPSEHVEFHGLESLQAESSQNSDRFEGFKYPFPLTPKDKASLKKMRMSKQIEMANKMGLSPALFYIIIILGLLGVEKLKIRDIRYRGM